MEKIKSFEDACKVKGLDAEKVLPDVAAFPAPHQKALIALAKLVIINDALNYTDNNNQDWKPDWSNYNEDKYYPWFDTEKHEDNNPTGFRLLGCVYDNAHSIVGARLVYRTRKLAEYAGEQFLDLYQDFMVLD